MATAWLQHGYNMVILHSHLEIPTRWLTQFGTENQLILCIHYAYICIHHPYLMRTSHRIPSIIRILHKLSMAQPTKYNYRSLVCNLFLTARMVVCLVRFSFLIFKSLCKFSLSISPVLSLFLAHPLFSDTKNESRWTHDTRIF